MRAAPFRWSLTVRCAFVTKHANVIIFTKIVEKFILGADFVKFLLLDICAI